VVLRRKRGDYIPKQPIIKPNSLRLAGNPRGMSEARVTNHRYTTAFIIKT